MMQDKSLVPIFAGDEMQRLRRCISWTWKTLKKVDRNPVAIQEGLFNETPAELIRSGSMFYMNPCASQTMVCLEALKANGFLPTVVLDVLRAPRGMNVHFAIEFC